jgi:hypothetical protein
MGCRFSLAVSAVSASSRLGPPWHHRDSSSLTDPTVQISRSGFLKPDSPLVSRHGESEAAATDDGVGARYIAPTSTGFRVCDDLATSSRSVSGGNHHQRNRERGGLAC